MSEFITVICVATELLKWLNKKAEFSWLGEKSKKLEAKSLTSALKEKHSFNYS